MIFGDLIADILGIDEDGIGITEEEEKELEEGSRNLLGARSLREQMEYDISQRAVLEPLTPIRSNGTYGSTSPAKTLSIASG